MLPSILIVEDEPAGQVVIESILRDQGYMIEFAANGREALEKAARLKPDLILLDIMLPEMDGIQVLQLLRKTPGLAKVPVVMLTALNDREIRIACLEAGADDFFNKPFDRAELRARVRSITKLNQYRLLYEQSQMFSLISEKASDGYLLLQASDQITYANPRARFYFGLDLEMSTPISGSFIEIATKQYSLQPFDAWDDWTAPITSDRPQIRYLVRPESNTAHEFWIEVTAYEIPRSDPPSRVVRLRDVTADILNKRNTRSFGEAITHKMRTPMTHILSSIDLLARHAEKLSPKEIGDLSQTALVGAKRLHETVSRVLAYANIYTNADSPNGLELAGFSELTTRVAEEIGSVSLNLQMPEILKQARLKMPVESMEVLLWEILGNSRKFHPDGTPHVTIEISPSANQTVTISISDNGISLSPKQLSTAWLPYYQGEKDFTGEVPGMGLGLSTVNTIVWGVGGTCSIMNRADGQTGVTIKMTLPAMRNH